MTASKGDEDEEVLRDYLSTSFNLFFITNKLSLH